MVTEKNGIHLFVTILSIIGIGLLIVISLSTILGWKMDTSIGGQMKALKEENDKRYVLRELYELQVKTFNENLKAIMRAVGAREPREIP
jgi:hypothetical protein